jgi:hypothetical protein
LIDIPAPVENRAEGDDAEEEFCRGVWKGLGKALKLGTGGGGIIALRES